jgi:plasmid maintenance system antidote protein VapI
MNTVSSMSIICINSHVSKKAAVSFDANVAQTETIGLEDFTPEEIEAVWYTGEEMENITQGCFKILDKIENGDSINEKRHCFRGLETHTLLGALSKTRNRATSIMSVLEEQRRQVEGAEALDDDMISKLYQRISSSSQMWAQVVGSRDQKEAEKFIDDEEDFQVTVKHRQRRTTSSPELSRQKNVSKHHKTSKSTAAVTTIASIIQQRKTPARAA